MVIEIEKKKPAQQAVLLMWRAGTGGSEYQFMLAC
jgi:hypothetical protein